MLIGWRRERQIREVLKGLARQRIAIARDGIWVLEKALKRDDDTDAALATSQMRGWVEPLHVNLPNADLDLTGPFTSVPEYTRTETYYRLTEGGWAAINRAHAWTLINVLIGVLALVVAFVALIPAIRGA